MIILLYLDGFIAFIANEFAKLFGLRLPCVLCTRVDHILAPKDPNSYCNDSICESHKKEFSSLAYCHVHRKLSYIRAMCKGCLLSFATEKESDPDTYKSLVGILHKDIECFAGDDVRLPLKSSRNDDIIQVDMSGSVQRCSCCGEALRMRSSSKTYARNLSMNGTTYSQAPAPSPRAAPLSWRHEEGRCLELPHIRFTELRFTSENESELREDDTGSNGYNPSAGREDKAASVPLLPDCDDINEDKTPIFTRGNKFFGIPLSDSASGSPIWANRNSRKLLFEKSDLIVDSIDTDGANDGEDDSILHRLKRQVRMDRKSLIALYMELDEERSASAVAANNAMAMITRLQAEKAAVQMEASQYRRMMEEQAEYDQEALQIMKAEVIKREEGIRVLEAELEAYREKYGDMKKIDSEDCEADADDDYQELKSQVFSDSSSNCEADHNVENKCNLEQSGESGGVILDESSLDFESEKSYLLGLLKDLETKINVPSDEVTHSSESDMVELEDDAIGKENKASLARELSIIRERLRSIDAESGFLKHAAMTLQRGGEGTKLLTDIAEHLRKLRHSEKMEDTDA